MPGLTPIVGHTTQEAQDKFAQMQALVDPVAGLDLLGIALGVAVELRRRGLFRTSYEGNSLRENIVLQP